MTTRRLALLTCSMLAALAGASGCRSSGGDAASGAAGAAGAPAATHAPDAPGKPPPPAEESLRAPVVLSLTEGPPAGGVIEVTAILDVAGPLSYPISLKLELPRDAKLAGGQAEETLQVTQAGRVTRSYKVQSAQPFAPDNPLRVVMHGQSATGGVHAVKQLPAKAEPGAPPPRIVPPTGKPVVLPPG
jgi:hypothetical protein